MSRIDELHQQIDACRAGSDDLHLPELSGLAEALGHDGVAKSGTLDGAVVREFDRSQRFDRNVVSALQDVSVPAGLLQRLLDSSAAARSAGADAVMLGAAVGAAVGESSQSPGPQPAAGTKVQIGVSRRGWLLPFVATGLIAVSTLAIAFAFWPAAPRDISREQLAADVPQWMNEIKSPDGWQGKPPTAVLEAYPVDSLHRGNRAVVTWRNFRTARGELGVVYDVTPAEGAPVRLFVIATPHRYRVAPSPPTVLPGMTGGVSVWAWQRSTGLLYVLVVERGGHPIEAYLRVAPQA